MHRCQWGMDSCFGMATCSYSCSAMGGIPRTMLGSAQRHRHNDDADCDCNRTWKTVLHGRHGTSLVHLSERLESTAFCSTASDDTDSAPGKTNELPCRDVIVFLRWLLISVYAIITTIAAMLITPIAVLFADQKTGLLPSIFRWMETPDQLLPGDPGIVGHPVTYWDWYKTSCKWLWRNPAYRATDPFKFAPLVSGAGMPVLDAPKGNINVNNQPFVPGYFYGTAENAFHKVFDLFIVWKWPGINKCLRIRFGWKLQPWYHGIHYDPASVVGMHVCSITPFMSVG